jgi:long-chain fatty acid transport protein
MGQRGKGKYVLFLLVLLFGSWIGVQTVLGSGFAIYTQGASSLGQAAATIAHTEDPSTIFYNPALINQLDGTQIMVGTTLMFPNREFTSDLTRRTFETEDDVFFPSTIFVTHKFSDKLSGGFGIFNPFGLGTTWPENWEGRFIATKSELTTYNFNPVLSYKVTPWLSFAAGANFLLLDNTLERRINFAAFGLPLPDGRQKFSGDGTGMGFNLGLLIEPHKDFAIGVSYRSEIDVDIDGDLHFDLPIIELRQLFPETLASTDMTLPQQLHFGVYVKRFHPFTFELAARWEGWSSFDRLALQFAQPVAGTTFLVSQRDWEDTWTGNLGLKYQLNDMVTLMGGYLYQGNPIPDGTFEPAIPDANAHLFTAGTNFQINCFKIAVAYGYQLLEKRDKRNTIDDIPGDGFLNPETAANGLYRSDLHMVGVSMTYSF